MRVQRRARPRVMSGLAAPPELWCRIRSGFLSYCGSSSVPTACWFRDTSFFWPAAYGCPPRCAPHPTSYDPGQLRGIIIFVCSIVSIGCVKWRNCSAAPGRSSTYVDPRGLLDLPQATPNTKCTHPKSWPPSRADSSKARLVSTLTARRREAAPPTELTFP